MKKLLLPMLLLLASTGLWAQSKSTGTVTLTTNMTAKFDMNNANTTVTLTLTGPSDRWFALQFGTFPGSSGGGMSPGQDLVYYNGTTLADAVHNGVGVTPSNDTNNWTVTSNTVSGSTRTIVATRPFNTGDSNDFTFVYSLALIDMAWARGSSAGFALSNHGGSNRGYQLNKPFTCAPPANPTASAQVFCSGATVSALQASGVAGATFKWYNSPTGGSQLAGTTVLNSGTYYVSQTVDDCESNRVAVTVTVNSITAQSMSNVTSCGSYTLPALNAGNNYYTASGGAGTMLTAGAAVTSTQTIYIYAQTNTTPNCTDENSFTVTISPVPAAPTSPDQTLCDGSTVSGLSVSGEAGASFSWYNVATGGTALAGSTPLTSGTYYAAQTMDGCESSRTTVNVIVNVINPPVVPDQAFCGNTAFNMVNVPAGDGFYSPLFYDQATGGSALNADSEFTTGVYYISFTDGICESGRDMVTLTVNDIPGAPTGTASQMFNTGETVANLEITVEGGATITWYVMDGSMQLVEVDPSTALTNGGEYYATQTLNGCESEPFMVTATENLGTGIHAGAQFTIYPNPAGSMLNLTAKGSIDSVSILNLLGQELISVKALGNTVSVNVDALQHGTYFVRVQNSNGTSSVKFIKE